MPAIFLQESLEPGEIETLRQEFSHYDLLFECHEKQWREVEILYGNQLTEDQLALATTRLRWIHSPNADTDGLCMEDITQQGNILVSLTKGQNVPQIAEFVIGTILAFAKQFFHWTQVAREPEEFWQWPLKETMWTLKDKTLLQVGLGEVGGAIVERANIFGMKTWGVRRQQSFHPYCHKTFSLETLNALLPTAHVVVVALPKRATAETIFGEEEFKLMRNDSIFIVVGSADTVDEQALAKEAQSGKFRGILLDSFRHPPPSKSSPLWNIPNGILTPSISSCPPSDEHTAFRLLRRNLRLFVQGKINEMKNLMQM